MTVPPKDQRQFKIDERGNLRVPRDVLEEAGLGPKMRVWFEVKGREILIRKAAGAGNVLDGPIGKKVDRDLFDKIQTQQDKDRKKAHDLFEKGIADADLDSAEPPDHPFRWG